MVARSSIKPRARGRDVGKEKKLSLARCGDTYGSSPLELRTAALPGVWQHLEVPQMMQPEAALGVCGRLGAGEEYSAQIPYPDDILLVIMMNVAPLTWPLCLQNSSGEKQRQTDPGWLLTPGHLAQAAPVAISLSSEAASSRTLGRRREAESTELQVALAGFLEKGTHSNQTCFLFIRDQK